MAQLVTSLDQGTPPVVRRFDAAWQTAGYATESDELEFDSSIEVVMTVSAIHVFVDTAQSGHAISALEVVGVSIGRAVCSVDKSINAIGVCIGTAGMSVDPVDLPIHVFYTISWDRPAYSQRREVAKISDR